jgi:TonB family protein
MAAVKMPGLDQTSHPAPVPQLLVELPSRSQVFFTNLRDLFSPRPLPPLELRSAPAAFWPDVFVTRRLPLAPFLKSAAVHVIACVLLVAFTRVLALQPRVQPVSAFDHNQVIYYSASEYLPPLDTRAPHAAPPRKADPELSRQPIISVPREPDNRVQTIVAPPAIKLKSDLALPNMIAWSDKPQKPRLDIPPVPLTPAAEITRLTPQLNSAVTPPPDRVERTLRSANSRLSVPQPAVIAPPPSVATPSTRLGELNIARTSVIAPAPSLPIADQRAVNGLRSSAPDAQIVPPPPSAAGSSAQFGARGRVIALNLHPSVAAPPDPPAGNRRGSFAATAAGHPGATGDPGSPSAGKETGNGSNEKGSNQKGPSDLPAGLYVGSAAANPSPVAGDPAQPASNSVNPNLTRPARVTSAPSRTTTDAAKLSEPERAVFGDRKFYSLTLNMPNLNSAGGSWVIRFAELNHNPSDAPKLHDANDTPPPTADLSQPQATRKVDPAYPLQLMRENVKGTVILYAVIHADGTVGNVRVLRSVDDRLDRFATEAVSQWKFTPATKNGAPVDVEATFQIPFKPTRLGANF